MNKKESKKITTYSIKDALRKENPIFDTIKEPKMIEKIEPESYKDLLKHPKWQRKRLEIMQRDDFKCQLCGDENTTLNVHHIKYFNFEPWNIESKYLITICFHCHESIEYLKKYDLNSHDFFNTKVVKIFDPIFEKARIMIYNSKEFLIFERYNAEGSLMTRFEINLKNNDFILLKKLINEL